MNDQITKERLHATIHGRVQGVGFRAFVYNSAKRLGVFGWVRNRFDGTVETVAEGERSRLVLFLQDVQRGPGPSHVSEIILEWLPVTGEFTEFEIRRTR